MRAKAADTQERDPYTGERVWLVRVIDLDTENQRKGQAEVAVKMAAAVQPAPPAAVGSPLPLVEFTGLTVTPYVDAQKCTGRRDERGQHRCGARQGYSLRAAGMREPSSSSRRGSSTGSASTAAAVQGAA